MIDIIVDVGFVVVFVDCVDCIVYFSDVVFFNNNWI